VACDGATEAMVGVAVGDVAGIGSEAGADGTDGAAPPVFGEG